MTDQTDIEKAIDALADIKKTIEISISEELVLHHEYVDWAWFDNVLTCLQKCKGGEVDDAKFKIGQYVRKKGDKGQWHGVICGTYSTVCTPEGYAVESIYEKNSVQIYPASALEPWGARPTNRGEIDE